MNSGPATGSAERGFRQLKVTARTRESRTISSFQLQPLHPDDWRDFEPGQFLVFRIPADNERGYVLRNYSVSSSPARTGSYRISVKREAASTAGVPDGLSSCYLHDHIQVGDILVAEGPRGEFRLDRTSSRPIVLLSGGVGLTPLVSMFHVLATQTERRTYFIHACDNGEVHALDSELRELAQLRPGLVLHTCYRFPSADDVASGRHDSEGVITTAVLQCLLALDDYDFYLCGPPPFMQGVYRSLRTLGVPKQRIAYEFFGPATVLEADRDAEAINATAVPASATASATASAQSPTVEFRKSGRSVVWEDSPSLLDFAEMQGLTPDFSCRAGICGSCKTPLLAGEVTYFQEPLDAPEAGSVLLCSCQPKGPIVLDL